MEPARATSAPGFMRSIAAHSIAANIAIVSTLSS